MTEALHQAEGLVAIPSARTRHEAVDLARHYHPTVLVADTALAAGDCAGLVRRVLAASPQTHILTVSTGDDEAALAALRAGAIGHASKDLDPQTLVALVLRAANGEAIVPRRLVTPLLRSLQAIPDGGWRPLRSRLTTREWEIIDLLASGASTEHIAECLVLSATTVYSHIKSVLRKLGVHSRRDAIAAAHQLRQEEVMGKKSPTKTAPNSPTAGIHPRHAMRASHDMRGEA
jgi:two-component system nitrate/nitrite response regulator NarL